MGINAARALDTADSVVAPHVHDLAAQSVDLHLDLVAAGVAALDLPNTVVELDLLDGGDTPGEGHIAHVIDGEVWAPAEVVSKPPESAKRTIHKNRRMMVPLFKIGDDGWLARAYIEGRIVPSPVSCRD